MRKNKAFTPQDSVKILTKDGVNIIHDGEITSEKIGLKAYGLSCIPKNWGSTFFIIPANELEIIIDSPQTLLSLLEDYNDSIYIRSSATNEDLDSRGSKESFLTEKINFLSTLKKACEYSKKSSDTIHWIIQNAVNAKHKGHLSNERRLRKDSRDFVLEIESYFKSVAVRRWREGQLDTSCTLLCDSNMLIDKCLKPVMQWTDKRKIRLHFEWVWDGQQIWIVQADECPIKEGVSPIAPQKKSGEYKVINELSVLRLATPDDLSYWGKLRKAKLHEELLDYELTDFYLLDNTEEIRKIINESPSDAISSDITKLITQGRVVVRTDLSKKTEQMLPRSDELGSLEAFFQWIREELSNWDEIIDDGICIIHHFIPSTASAWSHAEPNSRRVRIEALWGIPEGMYWYPHDVYEVDTLSDSFAFAQKDQSKYKVNSHTRHKERFFTSDNKGKWETHYTHESFDWKPTLNDKLCKRISLETRKIAEHSKKPMNVMWFITANSKGKEIELLPWYHHTYEIDKESIKEPANFKKQERFIYQIRTLKDWEGIKSEKYIDRLIINPSDEEIIRNKIFISELSQLAKEKNATIELSGGILSHAFYMLNKKKCLVEVNDLYGTEEETLEFNKIVRDKIPDFIKNNGENVIYKKASPALHFQLLKKKIIEESYEVFDAQTSSEIVEELADVQEVIDSLREHLKIGARVNNRPLGSRLFSHDLIVSIPSTLTNSETEKIFFRLDNQIWAFKLIVTRKNSEFKARLELSEEIDNNSLLNFPVSTVIAPPPNNSPIARQKEQLLFQSFELLDISEFLQMEKKLDSLEETTKIIRQILNISNDEFEEVQKNKRKKRGSFKNGYILMKTYNYQTLIKKTEENTIFFSNSKPQEINEIKEEITFSQDIRNGNVKLLDLTFPYALHNSVYKEVQFHFVNNSFCLKWDVYRKKSHFFCLFKLHRLGEQLELF